MIETDDNFLEMFKNPENVTTLSDKDRDIFLEMLKNPPEPNEAMKKAFKSREEMKKDELANR